MIKFQTRWGIFYYRGPFGSVRQFFVCDHDKTMQIIRFGPIGFSY